jgi:hypothetical protein
MLAKKFEEEFLDSEFFGDKEFFGDNAFFYSIKLKIPIKFC